MKNIVYCSVCNSKMTFFNTPNLGSGRLSDGGRVCRKCFKIIVKTNVDFGLKSKKYYSTKMVKDIVEEYKNPNFIKDRPLPKKEILKPVISDADEIDNEEYIIDAESININGLVFIEYTDSRGTKSKRRITIKSSKPYNNSDFLISAFCHEKQAHRTFKMSNIDTLIDLETGEIIEDVVSFFSDRYNNSPLGQITSCFQKFQDEILIMAFIARADGVLRKKERDIIITFLLNKCTQNLDVKLLDKEIRRTYCESSEFRGSIKSMKNKSEEDKQNVLKLVRDIIMTDKNPDPMELGALELIVKEFNFKNKA